MAGKLFNYDTVDLTGLAEEVLTLFGTGAVIIPKGSDGEQPGTPVSGMLRYSSTTNMVEFYNGSSWDNLVGGSSGGFVAVAGDTMTGDLDFDPAVQIRLDDGTAADPALTFVNDTDTGIYRSATGNILFSSDSNLITTIDASGLIIATGAQLFLDAGTLADPGITFTGDTDTGFYNTAGSILISINAGAIGNWNTSGLTLSSGSQLLLDDGTATDPAIVFASDTGTGIYTTGAGILAIASATTATAQFDNIGLSLAAGSQLGLDDGTVTDPALMFTSDTDTGIYWGGAGILTFTANGADSVDISTAGLVMATGKQIQAADGTKTLPAISFANDSNTGFYSGSDGVISVSINDTDIANWDSGGLTMKTGAQIVTDSGNIAAPGLTFTGALDTGIYLAGANQMRVTSLGIDVLQMSHVHVVFYQHYHLRVGNFAVDQDAQVSHWIMRNITTNATITELFLNGSSSRLTLPDNSTWRFEIDIVARRTDTDDESAAWKLKGCIDRNTGEASTALVGTVSKEVTAKDSVAWDISASADSTNGALTIDVTGEVSKTIQWVAYLTIVETIG